MSYNNGHQYGPSLVPSEARPNGLGRVDFDPSTSFQRTSAVGRMRHTGHLVSDALTFSAAARKTTKLKRLNHGRESNILQSGLKRQEHEWISLLDNGEYEVQQRISDIQAVRSMDLRRKKLLTMSRNLSPVDTVGRLSLLPRTVLPRIGSYWQTWIIFGAFIASATSNRLGVGYGVLDLKAFDGGTAVITFMVVFYVGYCYTRYNQQFDDVERIMHSIINACMFARVHFVDPDEVHRLWRYLNMLHAAAYTGLTVSYSEGNFFKPLCEKYSLFSSDQQEREAEEHLLDSVSIDGEDTRACAMLQVWVLELIKNDIINASCRTKPSPIFKSLNDEVQKVGDSVKRLFTYQYQVLPFIYTHLVSICCTAYLLFFAFLKGLHFDPSAGYTFGFVLPLCSVVLSTLAIFGLLEVGDTIGDPFGKDPEDFAVLHFVEVTAVASLETINVDSVISRKEREKYSFYSNKELRAALSVVTRMVYRFRQRKARRDAAYAEKQAEEMRAAEEHRQQLITYYTPPGGHECGSAPHACGAQGVAPASPMPGSMSGSMPGTQGMGGAAGQGRAITDSPSLESSRAELRMDSEMNARPVKVKAPSERQKRKPGTAGGRPRPRPPVSQPIDGQPAQAEMQAQPMSGMEGSWQGHVPAASSTMGDGSRGGCSCVGMAANGYAPGEQQPQQAAQRSPDDQHLAC